MSLLCVCVCVCVCVCGREEILKAAKAVAMATEDLVQKAQSGNSLHGHDSPDGGEYQPHGSSLLGGVWREELAMAARHAVSTLDSQTSLVKSGAASLSAGDKVEGQVRERGTSERERDRGESGT